MQMGLRRGTPPGRAMVRRARGVGRRASGALCRDPSGDLALGTPLPAQLQTEVSWTISFAGAIEEISQPVPHDDPGRARDPPVGRGRNA